MSQFQSPETEQHYDAKEFGLFGLLENPWYLEMYRVTWYDE